MGLRHPGPAARADHALVESDAVPRERRRKTCREPSGERQRPGWQSRVLNRTPRASGS